MTDKPENPAESAALGRRDFLKVVGVAGAAAALPKAAEAADSSSTMTMPMPAAASSADASPGGWVFFNGDEVTLVTAIVDTLIPSDATGPGGVEAGIVTYIDRQLGGAYGQGARLYLAGPFADGTPSQGYQLPYNPGDLIHLGLIDLAAYAQTSKGKAFDQLAAADRDAVLKDLDGSKASFPTVPEKVFFDHVFNLVQEGYFGDNVYGGNKNKAVWKMIGFPGVAGMYTQLIEQYRNKVYTTDPQSIADFS